MNKRSVLILLVIFDAMLAISFIASNWWVWNYFNGKITANTWGPLQIAIAPQTIVDGEATTIGTYSALPNYPFILFWVALAVNFAFVVLALRNNDKKWWVTRL